MAGLDAAAIVALGLTAVGTGYAVYSGEEASQNQKRGLRQQAAAQQKAESMAARQQKLAAEASAAANRKAPDLAEILASEDELSRLSSSQTRLTAPKAPPRQPASTLGGY